MDKTRLVRMRNHTGRKRNFRVTSLISSALFLFFLIELMPHRVHHMFEKDAGQDCVTFTVSKGCTLNVDAAAHVSIVQTAKPLATVAVGTWLSPLASSPFLQRAPPKA
jgi:hypothetical protein